ncbi:MAG: peptidylprolyl isomerase [Candidatus Doudnabacteria bacterium]|nr:peptidylprolyl isomerase [Candidatus Doudnabacteria bacterium]
MKKKRLKNIRIGAVFFAILLVLSVVWLYTRNGLTQSKAKVLRFLPLPIALVDSKPLFAEGFLQIKNSLSDPNKFSDREVYEAYINYEAKKTLVQKLKISFDEKSGWSNIFKNSESLDVALKTYFNQSEVLNPEPYNLSKNLVSRIRQGEDFANVAKSYSNDEYSKYFGGFAGILTYNEVLPEIKAKLEVVRVGEISVMASRYGLHIIQVTEKLSEKAQIRQINLLVPGYEKWLESELDKIKIKIIIKP